jgi:hypothetical protein
MLIIQRSRLESQACHWSPASWEIIHMKLFEIALKCVSLLWNNVIIHFLNKMLSVLSKHCILDVKCWPWLPHPSSFSKIFIFLTRNTHCQQIIWSLNITLTYTECVLLNLPCLSNCTEKCRGKSQCHDF